MQETLKNNELIIEKTPWELFEEANLAGATGELPQNEFLSNMFNKIGNQIFIQSFEYDMPLLTNYSKASSIFGSIDEIVATGLANRKDFKHGTPWIDEVYVTEQFRTWATMTYKDEYRYDVPYFSINWAMINEAGINRIIALFANSVEEQKQTTWNKRIKEMHKKIPLVHLLAPKQADETDEQVHERWAQEITEAMKQMKQPTTQFNWAGKTNATKIEKQQLTWNIKYKNKVEWLATKLFKDSNLQNFASFLANSYELDYEDDSVVAVLDTAQTFYITLKNEMTTFFNNVGDQRYQHFRFENYITTYVPFQNGIVFKIDQAVGKQKVDLETVIDTKKVVEISELTPEAVKEAVKEANAEFVGDTDHLGISIAIVSNNEGLADINAIYGNTDYKGHVKVAFKLVSGSNN